MTIFPIYVIYICTLALTLTIIIVIMVIAYNQEIDTAAAEDVLYFIDDANTDVSMFQTPN